jgi:hypothetical protein
MKETNFKLNKKQEEELIKYSLDRLKELEADNLERIEVDRLAWKIYANDRSDRVGHDTIYAQSNVPIPLTSLIVDHFLARAEDDITGTAPYFRFEAQGPQDMEMVKAFDKYFNWKLDKKARTRERLEESYLHIFLQRAAVFKAVYEENTSIWYDYERSALFDNVEGDFVKTMDDNYVLEGEAQFEPITDPMTGETVMSMIGEPGIEAIKGRHDFQPLSEGIPTQLIRYKGPRSVVVDSDRFLCPSNVEHIEEADCLVESYDKDMTWCKDMFLEREWLSYGDFKQKMKKDANPRTDSDRNKEYKENLSFDDDKNPLVKIKEFWIRRDVLGTGEPQEFCIFIDPETENAIYYEYVAKVTPDNKIPYSCVSIGKQKNRWWGPSLPEKIGVYQEYLDKQFNSQSYRNEMAANPIIGVNPQAVEDEPDDIELYAGKLFELKDQHKMEDFLTFAVVPNVDTKTQELIDFVFGMVQLWLGVSNLAQGDYQALAPANTATGVEATLKEASKIGRRWMRRIVRGFEEHLTKLVKIAMTTLDEPEVFEYMEGDVTQFGTVTPEMVEKLETNARVILSQNQDQRALEKANMALQTQERYFSYAPEMQQWTRPLLVEILGAMGYDNIDELLPPGAPQDPRAEAEMMKLMADAQGGGGSGGGSGGAAPAKQDSIGPATQGMGNSNPQGQNQYQQSTG